MLMKRYFPLAALGVALTIGCGDDSEPAGPGTGGTLFNQGIFVDAPCAGLDYIAARGTDDEIKGVTDASGTFTYVPGQNVVFLVGGLCLGDAPASARMNPLQLVDASDVTAPAATNIARLLQTLDDDANSSNGIQISAAVREAASSHWLDFSLPVDSFATDALTVGIVQVLTTATQAGERPLVSAAEAQANLTSGIRAGYQGTYRGKYCRSGETGMERGGDWTMLVGPNGDVSITFRGTPAFTVTGTMDLNGRVEILTTGAVRASFAPTFGGTWEYIGQAGGVFYSGWANCGTLQ
jgi:hypothetical protein